MSGRRTLFVGVGSPHGDDQIGWLVADRIAEVCDDGVDVRKAASPADLLDWLADVERPVICDACRGLGRAGEIVRLEWPAREIEKTVWSGTHNLSLASALALADRLGRLPSDVVIWAVEAQISDPGASLSAPVADALAPLLQRISNELQPPIRNEASR